MEDGIFTGKGVLINKETGKVHRINLKPATLHDIQIHSEQPAIGNSWSVECKWVKPLSKRKARKFRYFIERLCKPRKRKYISKRELVTIIERAFYPNGLPLPFNYYMERSHRQLMNLLVNTAYLVKKERESRHIFTPLPQVETPIEQSH